jgi:hypothetical protein
MRLLGLSFPSEGPFFFHPQYQFGDLAVALCSARLQAGDRLNQQGPPEGRGYETASLKACTRYCSHTSKLPLKKVVGVVRRAFST